jgi:glycolate oxidase
MPLAQALAELRTFLPADAILTDPSELLVYEADGFTVAHARPAAVVFARSTAEVSRIVRVLAREDVPIVPRGSGTGLTGGCVGFGDGVIISTVRMNRILEIDLANRAAWVEAGVRNTALSDDVARRPAPWAASTRAAHNLHFAPDPSSQRASTIGGNAATGAGGIHTLKDFVTSNHILGLELVLADGRVVEIGGGGGAADGGPLDLPGLLCGSEGTLGIITRLWVRLVPKAPACRTLVATFTSSADACHTVSDIIAAGHLPAAMEMLDGVMVRTIEEAFHFGIDPRAAALLLIEIDGLDELLDEPLRQIMDLARSHAALTLEASADPQRRAEIWRMRRSAFGAIGRIAYSYCTQDACIPRSRLPEALERIGEIGRRYGLTIPNVFHAGDGNIHPIFLYDERDEAQVQNILRAAEEVLEYALSLGGTISGEHGIGVEKIHLMGRQFDRPTLDQFRAVRRAFDPAERLNPGKLIPGGSLQVELLKPGRQVPQ